MLLQSKPHRAWHNDECNLQGTSVSKFNIGNGIEIRVYTYKPHIKRIEVLQKRIITIISAYIHVFFAEAGLLKLNDFIHLNVRKHLHRAFNHKLPLNLPKNYSKNPRHKYKT